MLKLDLANIVEFMSQKYAHLLIKILFVSKESKKKFKNRKRINDFIKKLKKLNHFMTIKKWPKEKNF